MAANGQRSFLCALRPPRIFYVVHVNARALTTGEGVANDLANNILHGVRWYDAARVLSEIGCDLFLEMRTLARRNPSRVDSIPVGASVLPRASRLTQEQEVWSER
jgi:malonate decarboxylase epsilon subunit